MAQKKKRDQKGIIAQAALDAAAKGGWESVSFRALARKTGLQPFDITHAFGDVAGIIVYVSRDLEKRVAAEVGPYLGDNWRDNIMEILMTRFDMAAENREAFAGIPDYALHHPVYAPKFLDALMGMSERILHLSGFPFGRVPPQVAAAAFAAFYLSVVYVWKDDDGEDHAKTMAAIDRRLSWIEKLSEFTLKAAA